MPFNITQAQKSNNILFKITKKKLLKTFQCNFFTKLRLEKITTLLFLDKLLNTIKTRNFKASNYKIKRK